MAIISRNLAWVKHYSEGATVWRILPVRPQSVVLDAPYPDWIFLNVDGATSSLCLDGTIGGLFRNGTGAWIMDFAKAIGHTNSLQVELWALFEVLSLVRAIHRLRQKSWDIIPRDDNRLADAMAKLVSCFDFSLHVYLDPPLGVDLLLTSDKNCL
ncbi:hypothetical protein V6N11_036731 [Hibiscus sabdariffa]|uniref:RNase H type-1 domain-containing protein n=1 Tax=Hibiscus sabdariffa TaxID=183260 RepID=A0ABR2RB96_9ROSI